MSGSKPKTLQGGGKKCNSTISCSRWSSQDKITWHHTLPQQISGKHWHTPGSRVHAHHKQRQIVCLLNMAQNAEKFGMEVNKLYVHEFKTEAELMLTAFAENASDIHSRDSGNLSPPQPFYGPFFRDYPSEPVPDFMVQGKITKADTLTIQMGTTSIIPPFFKCSENNKMCQKMPKDL